MKRILVPVDGSPRSLIALEQLKTTFSPKAFEVVLVMVRENTGYALSLGEEAEIREELDKKLNSIARTIDKYSVITRSAVGRAGARVIEAAKEFGAEMIVMTKSTKPGAGSTIGLTASYIIRHAQCDVMIVKESETKKIQEYRGAIYKRAKGTVALRGQLSLKQSECLIPSVKGDVIYHIDVKRGRVRFLHRSFNAVTKEWDLPPTNGQQEVYEIEAGVSIQIPVNATGDGKMADRIRILNRSMKTEAVFDYEITADKRALNSHSASESSEIQDRTDVDKTDNDKSSDVKEALVSNADAVTDESVLEKVPGAEVSNDSSVNAEEATETLSSVTSVESAEAEYVEVTEPEAIESKVAELDADESEATESEAGAYEQAGSETTELVVSEEAAETSESEDRTGAYSVETEETEETEESSETLDLSDLEKELESIPKGSKDTIAAIEKLCATGAIDAVELIKALDELEAKSEESQE
ncbi:MAG: universal stress protein [Mogibacterium sp.]|uniref:universal stress protein n=1 Tax=Mogibacterium sp. TaxID=2049035 RepID=UPI0017DA7DD9|nr:universal stress protein [Mogibacterium sp.]MBB1533245.1 universal stress protein [Mogibacterium sp.]